MKKLILISFVVLLTACNTRHTEIIDGCEYIVSDSWNGHGYTESLTHKGGCKNPIHGNIKDTTQNIVPQVINEPLKYDMLIKDTLKK
jgi:hypothetical protein